MIGRIAEIKKLETAYHSNRAKFVSDEYRLDSREERKLTRREIAVSELLPKKCVVHKVLITTFGIARHECMWSYQNVVTLKDLMA